MEGCCKCKSLTEVPRYLWCSLLHNLQSGIWAYQAFCSNINTICKIYKICYSTPPPARSLYTTMGPAGKCASDLRIADNKVAVFPPDSRINIPKLNGAGAGCGCNMRGPCGCSISLLPLSAGSWAGSSALFNTYNMQKNMPDMQNIHSLLFISAEDAKSYIIWISKWALPPG